MNEQAEFVMDRDCYERLREYLAFGNVPLCGWQEIEVFCKNMRMQTRVGTPPKRETLIKWGMPYCRQGLHGEAWTTSFIIIAWYVQLVQKLTGHKRRPKGHGSSRDRLCVG